MKLKRALGKAPKSRSSLQTPIKLIPAKANLRPFSVPTPRFPPLNVPFPSVPLQNFSNQLAPPRTTITELKNGLRVASEDTYSQLTSFSLYVKCGTRHEPVDKPGISYLLERMSFRTTKNRTTAQIVQRAEELGCSFITVGDKENIVFSFVTLRETLPQAFELLADTITHPKFEDEEMEDQLQAIQAEQDSIKDNNEFLLAQSLHKIAFSPHSLGNVPMDYWETIRSQITKEDLIKYKEKHFVGSRMVLSAASVDHDPLVELANKYLGSLPLSNGTIESPPVKYVGGYAYLPLNKDEQEGNFREYYALMFKTCGWIEDDSYPTAVLVKILGGGSSFSAGGPGKGMFTRLYVNFMNLNNWVESAEAVLTNYEDIGLVGIHASCKPGHLSQLVEGVCYQFMQVAYDAVYDREKFEEELNRAKHMLKSGIFTNLEQRSIIADDIGRQVLVYGKRYSAEYVCDKVDSITVEDCARVARQLFQNPPTIVAVGLPKSEHSLPSYDRIKSFFASIKDL